MKKFSELKNERWFANALAGCIAALVFVTLSNWGSVIAGLKTFTGWFNAVIGGCIIAYIMDSLAELYDRTIFKRVTKAELSWKLSVMLTIITVIVLVAVMLVTLIPQLIDGVSTFINQLPGYMTSAEELLGNFGIGNLDLDSVIDSSESIINHLGNFISEHGENFIKSSSGFGKSAVAFAIACVLSVYILLSKNNIVDGSRRLLRALSRPERYNSRVSFLKKCDEILSCYIIYNLIDSAIVGAVNLAVMLICGMPYAGLVTIVVALTNLIPTFGPLIGAVIAAFILAMAAPKFIIPFLILTVILQTCDGYIIKPRLFGNSLGISGLLILVGILVGGNIAGVTGILLATPVVAILDYAYKDRLLPLLERRRAAKDSEE